MLFFDINFLLLFLLPLLVFSALITAFGYKAVLPWLASAASLVFIGIFSWVSVVIAVVSLSINYIAGRYLLGTHPSRKWVLVSAIIANLLILAYFKYSVLLDDTFFGGDVPFAWKFALPLGVSFYTFQQIAFISDIYRGVTTSFSLRTYVLFKVFFPQLIAGPIVHFERVRASYERWPTFNARSIKFGLSLLAIGFVKKLVGDYFGGIADPIFDGREPLNFYSAWVGALAFSMQIYFDFSGYSDMAVGLARMFGVSLPFNFNSPYKAKSLAEFWRRWHITLSRWLRDYLYIPLGGNRHGVARMYAALFITMALGGLWHGAAWTFLAWGALHGLGQIIARTTNIRLPAVAAHALLLLFIMLTWILFRANSFSGALTHYAALVSVSPSGFGIELRRIINLVVPLIPIQEAPNLPAQLSQIAALFVAVVSCLCLPNSQQIALWVSARKVRILKLADLGVMAIVIVLLALLFISPDTNNAFIYFEF